MTAAHIAGWAHSRFGKLDAPDLERLIRDIVPEALAHAGVEAADVDGVFLGVYNNGFLKQSFEAGLIGMAVPELRRAPAVRLENACATGSAALYAALDFIEAGRGRIALVVGAEKMTAIPAPDAAALMLSGSYLPEEGHFEGGFAGVFGHIAQSYFQKYGDHSAELGMIAAKNHANGAQNRYAHMQKDLGVAFCSTVSDKNPYVAGPLRRTDCSLISDGAAALVLADAETTAGLNHAIAFRARSQANDVMALSQRDPTEFNGAARAWAASLDQAGATLADLDFVETHDCFTIAELIEYEAMGLAPRGEGGRVVRDGVTRRDGKLPVNPSGGLKARGHPLGATGVSMHVMAAMQLAGEAGTMQLARADLAGVFNMGGAAVANYCSILERAMTAPVSLRVPNLAYFLTRCARRHPDDVAIVYGEMRWTWREFDARVSALAAALAKVCGVGKGDRVLVQSANNNQMLEIMMAVYRLGAVWTPANFRQSPAESAYMCEKAGASVMIVEHPFAAHAEACRPMLNHVVSIGALAGAHDYETLIADQCDAAFPNAVVERDDPCWLFFTSGSTGRPKAVVLTHGQLTFTTLNHLNDLMPGLGPNHASLVVAPLSHGAAMHQLVQIAAGAKSVILPQGRLDPAVAWDLVERWKIANMFTVPTIVKMLVEHPAAQTCDHSSLRHVVYAGAPMFREDQKRALRVLGPVLVQYYGLGEVTGAITVLRPGDHHVEDGPESRIGTCGVERTGVQVEIQDDAGNALPPMETGEICVIGPAVFAGYYQDDDANAKAFRNGWFRTGDLGHMDADGFVYITGRASDMYISGGSNVYPREIEEALLTLEGVGEVAVLGVPDPKWGEVGLCVCVAEAGRSATQEALSAHLAGRFAKYKLPQYYVFLDEMPKTAYGKITKKLVREELLARGLMPAPVAELIRG